MVAADVSHFLYNKPIPTDLNFAVTQSAKPTPLWPAASPATSHEKLLKRPDVTSRDIGTNLEDWRTPLVRYFHDPTTKVDKSVWKSTSKYVLQMNSIGGPPKICCLTAWDLIKQE